MTESTPRSKTARLLGPSPRDCTSAAGEASPEDHAAVVQEANPFTFKWNGRVCSGTALHRAVIDGDISAVKDLLDKEPSLLTSRFTYETTFGGQVQLGSGEAIHLAATRHSTEMVEVLVERKAGLDSYVTRDSQNHYDVFHAAVFSEGVGCSLHMIRLLLELKAPMTPNLAGEFPLHKAYQTGLDSKAIRLLQEETEARGINLFDECDGKVPTPLELGISMGKFTTEELSEVAPLTPTSAMTLIKDDPLSIPAFSKRVEAERVVGFADGLSERLQVSHMIKLLHEFPDAAVALLSVMTERPHCRSEGWHPLPKRASLGPRSRFQRLLPMTAVRFGNLYQRAKDWDFDTVTFSSPNWHVEITGKFGPPVVHVQVMVCKLQNIICEDFLLAISTGEDDALSIFESDVIHGVIEQVWWHGAIRVDIVQFALSMWGLSLLLAECMVTRVHRELVLGVAHDFISARGFVDLIHEAVQVAGFFKCGHGASYFNLGNAFDILRSALPVVLFFHPEHRWIRVSVILTYWMRLLEVNFSESMSRELLPISRLARGLLPAMVVAIVAFCSLTHAFYSIGDLDGSEEHIFVKSFSMLIGGEVPGSLDFEDGLQVFLVYGSILMFTVFFMNIFIGVIGENYSQQKSIAHLVFRKMRAQFCLAYLLRASTIPAWLCSPIPASLVVCMAALFMGGLQLAVVVRGVAVALPLPALFAALQIVMVVFAYQNPEAPWLPRRSRSPQFEELQPHYLWCVKVVGRSGS